MEHQDQEPEWHEDVDQICKSIIKFVTFFIPISLICYTLIIFLSHHGYMNPILEKFQPRESSPLDVLSILEPDPNPGSGSGPEWKLSIAITSTDESRELSYEFVVGIVQVAYEGEGYSGTEGFAFRAAAWAREYSGDRRTAIFSTNISNGSKFGQEVTSGFPLSFSPWIGVRVLNPEYSNPKSLLWGMTEGFVFACPHYMSKSRFLSDVAKAIILSGRPRKCTIAGTLGDSYKNRQCLSSDEVACQG